MEKSIAVLTSGGDSQGMNAVIRAVVCRGILNGYKVIGINRGYKGLLEKDIVELDNAAVSDIISKGGTMLRCARCTEMLDKEVQKKAADNCRELGIEGVVVVGGDGSFKGAKALSDNGINCIGIPGTIDNDLAYTEDTIGYDTAMNIALDMADRLNDTANSHDKCSVIEVMGRDAGWIALNVAVSSGAVGVVVPEYEFDFEALVERINKLKEKGIDHSLVIFAEGCGDSTEFAKKISERTGVETRVTVLGHVQRGGSPTIRDRVLATEMGCYAVDLLAKGMTGRIIGTKNGRVYDVDIYEGLAMKKPFNESLYKIANELTF